MTAGLGLRPWVTHAVYVPDNVMGLSSRKIVDGGDVVGIIVSLTGDNGRKVVAHCWACEVKRSWECDEPTFGLGVFVEHYLTRHKPIPLDPARPSADVVTDALAEMKSAP